MSMSRQPNLSSVFVSFVRVMEACRAALSVADVAKSESLVEGITEAHAKMAFYTGRTDESFAYAWSCRKYLSPFCEGADRLSVLDPRYKRALFRLPGFRDIDPDFIELATDRLREQVETHHSSTIKSAEPAALDTQAVSLDDQLAQLSGGIAVSQKVESVLNNLPGRFHSAGGVSTRETRTTGL